ncbi:hypothetical protein ACFS7Z_01165 [Pontibacter toksunensis]|uniref:IPT/TIG domain-containing protein n=1 Tax=Pontibacter toksunensis TaxID=1332631 RepID=A0ABW6BRC4_9BACT
MNVKLLQIRWSTGKNSLTYFTTALFAMLLMAFSGYAQTETDAYTAAGLPVPTVTSDKEDYAPGEVAIITGTGWTLDQQVDVHFEETPAFHA